MDRGTRALHGFTHLGRQGADVLLDVPLAALLWVIPWHSQRPCLRLAVRTFAAGSGGRVWVATEPTPRSKRGSESLSSGSSIRLRISIVSVSIALRLRFIWSVVSLSR